MVRSARWRRGRFLRRSGAPFDLNHLRVGAGGPRDTGRAERSRAGAVGPWGREEGLSRETPRLRVF